MTKPRKKRRAGSSMPAGALKKKRRAGSTTPAGALRRKLTEARRRQSFRIRKQGVLRPVIHRPRRSGSVL